MKIQRQVKLTFPFQSGRNINPQGADAISSRRWRISNRIVKSQTIGSHVQNIYIDVADMSIAPTLQGVREAKRQIGLPG